MPYPPLVSLEKDTKVIDNKNTFLQIMETLLPPLRDLSDDVFGDDFRTLKSFPPGFNAGTFYKKRILYK